MGFKFLSKDTEQPDYIDQDRFAELVGYNLRNNIMPVITEVTGHFRSNVSRQNISDEEWLHILKQQRYRLMDKLFEEGFISHEIISQDENGFSLRTEVRL
jgi:hypothetical protein